MSHGLSKILRLLILTMPVLLFRCSESNFKGADKKSEAQKKADVNKVDIDATSSQNPIDPIDPIDPISGGGNANKPCTDADVISFEAAPEFAPVRGMSISNQFEASHGVSFSIEGASASPVLAQINVGNPNAFEGAGSNINVLADTQSKDIMKTYFLTLPIRHAVLVVTYSKPVKEASGYMFDIDNSENWTITPYDANGRELAGAAWQYGVPSGDSSNNGKATLWTIKQRPTADISMIKFKGVKPANSNGASLAFDRFSPGKICP